MTTVGAVLMLANGQPDRRRVIEKLKDMSEITVGEIIGDRLPIAVETLSLVHDRDVWNRLREMPSILHYEIAFACFDDSEETDEL